MNTTPSGGDTNPTPVIDIADLHFSYGEKQVLKGLDLRVQPGEIVTLLGPNGAGKTTLVENLLGSLTPARGSVRILGCNPKHGGNEFWCQVGLVQQHWNDHNKWRVKDQLEWLRAAYASIGRTPLGTDEILRQLDLLDKKDTNLGRLSGGQRRRVDLACALLPRPSLLILDEPTTGLDPEAKAQIHDLLSSIADQGNTIFLTTHDLSEAEKLASRVMILSRGKFAASGSPRQLRAHLSSKAQITWFEDGVEQVHSTEQVEAFLLTLDLHHISGLTITRPTLEDAYLSLVKADEATPAEVTK